MASRASRKGWRTVRFGDVVRLSAERCADPAAEGVERYVGLEHIEPGDLRVRRWGMVADGTTFTSRFRPGQVLFGKRRAYQRKIAVADFEGVCSGDIYVFEPRGNDLLPGLLPFLCQTEAFFGHAVGTSDGSLSPRTNWRSLAEWEFALPPLEEQEKIFELLKSSYERLQAFRDLKSSCSRLVSSVREHLFSQPGMRRTLLRQLVTNIQAGKSAVGTDQPPHGTLKGVLKVSAVGANGFIPDESKTLLDQATFNRTYEVKKGDLLITRCNTPDLVGMSCLVHQDFPNLMLCDKTLRLVPVRENYRNLLLESLRCVDVRRQIKAVATGTGAAMKNISQEKIYSLEVPWPSTDAEIDATIQALRTTSGGLGSIDVQLFRAEENHSELTRIIWGDEA